MPESLSKSLPNLALASGNTTDKRISRLCRVPSSSVSADDRQSKHVGTRPLREAAKYRHHPPEDNVSTHLAIEALIELACRAQRGVDWRAMYNMIHDRLVAMNLLPRSSVRLQPLRLMYEQMFASLLISARHAAQANASVDSPLHRGAARPTDGATVAWLPASPSVLRMSRFAAEFQQLGWLGRGGFASVLRCRSRIDGQLYAVKCVTFAGGGSARQAAATVREVAVLAALSHRHVVRYHTAWLEPQWPPDGASAASDSPAQSSQVRAVVWRRPVHSSSSAAASSRGVDDSWCTSTGSTDTDAAADVAGASSRRGGRFWRTSGNGSSTATASTASTHGLQQPPSGSVRSCSSGHDQWPARGSGGGRVSTAFTLFIQMQLCRRTLRHWLCERNASVAAAVHVVSDGLHLARQLASALRYVHAQGVVHRDLKPDNVFIGADSRLLLGDFGLARRYLPATRADCMSDVRPTLDDDTLAESGDSRHIDVECDQQLAFGGTRRSAVSFESSCAPVACVGAAMESQRSADAEGWTPAVGTASYAAPEQLSECEGGGVGGGTAVDMFSFGLVLLELVQPFSTDAERYAAFMRLRGAASQQQQKPRRQRRLWRDVDEQLRDLWPRLADTIVALTHRLPQRRPTAAELLDSGVLSQSVRSACGCGSFSSVRQADSRCVTPSVVAVSDQAEHSTLARSYSPDERPVVRCHRGYQSFFLGVSQRSGGLDDTASSGAGEDSKSVIEARSPATVCNQLVGVAISDVKDCMSSEGSNNGSSLNIAEEVYGELITKSKSMEAAGVRDVIEHTASRSCGGKDDQLYSVSMTPDLKRCPLLTIDTSVRGRHVHSTCGFRCGALRLRARLGKALREASVARKKCVILARKLAHRERQLRLFRRQMKNASPCC